MQPVTLTQKRELPPVIEDTDAQLIGTRIEEVNPL